MIFFFMLLLRSQAVLNIIEVLDATVFLYCYISVVWFFLLICEMKKIWKSCKFSNQYIIGKTMAGQHNLLNNKPSSDTAAPTSSSFFSGEE